LGVRWVAPQLADERGRISSEGAGSNPSPVPRRLEKAPSRDTLSPQERAVFPTLAPTSRSRYR
jgi:hypothetical protein